MNDVPFVRPMKPIKTKPMLYAYYLPQLQEIAASMGYNLVIHGSMNRDCDLIAIPWVDNPAPHFELIKAFDYKLTGRNYYTRPANYMYSVLPGGRHNYIININRGGYDETMENYIEDWEGYLDISITPLPVEQIALGLSKF
jgi:hypothetical protein